MATGIKYTAKPTFRDMQGRFAAAERELLSDRREMARQLGRYAVNLMQDEAPKGETGKFAKGIRFRTFQTGDTVGFSTSLPQPLGKWITGGTRPHVITPKRPGYPLRFFWARVGRVVFFYRVNHPGTKPNPFVKRAYDRWRPKAESEMRRISTRFVANLTR